MGPLKKALTLNCLVWVIAAAIAFVAVYFF